jgi:hypothetical protein
MSSPGSKKNISIDKTAVLCFFCKSIRLRLEKKGFIHEQLMNFSFGVAYQTPSAFDTELNWS